MEDRDEALPGVPIRPKTECPSCGVVLEFSVRLSGVQVVGSTPPALPRFTDAEQDVLTAAKQAGLWEPFVATVQQTRLAQTPKNMERFFLLFLQKMTRRLIPAQALTTLATLFHPGYIEYRSADGIGVVLVDGAMRMFIANELLRGTPVKTLKGGGTRRVLIEDSEEKLAAWIRTRYGYVAGPGAFADTLRKRAFGEFASPDLRTGHIAHT